MNMAKFVTVLIFIFALLIPGCSSVSDMDSSKTPESSSWLLKSMSGVTVVLTPGNNITLEFDKNTHGISGFGGCNRFFGTYAINGDSVFFGAIGSTEMACDNLKTETDYYALLKKAETYKIKSGKLTLYSGGSAIMIFDRK